MQVINPKNLQITVNNLNQVGERTTSKIRKILNLSYFPLAAFIFSQYLCEVLSQNRHAAPRGRKFGV